jgi:hypothetical protein
MHICTYVYKCEREYYHTYNNKFECMKSQNTVLTVTGLETGGTSRRQS